MSHGAPAELLKRQLAYYRARAPEYDDWFLRRGRYDRGADANARWFEQVETVRAALAAERPFGSALELACGTGLWTRELAPHCESLTAVDGSPEVIAINRSRAGTADVRYVRADLFDWRPPAGERFDFVFFGFWLSHVPTARLPDFWDLLRDALAEDGRVFFVDSQFAPTSTAVDHELDDRGAGTARRRLDDGREFEIVKIFYTPSELESLLSAAGFRAQVRGTEDFFSYGTASLAAR